MAFATRTLRDTKSLVTILVDIDADAASNLILDGSGLGSFANGAKVDIRKIWWGLVQGTAANNTGDVEIEFKGSSADTTAIRLAGSGYYDGSAGLIEGNATNTTATSADVEAVTRGTSGFIMIEFKKRDGGWTG
jgi:hypothetical protein